MSPMSVDDQMMLELIKRSQRGEGFTRTNPLVAAGLARDGEWLAVDHHPEYGAGHAEARLLESWDGDLTGGTLYTTLEPCIHPGKTPSCVKRLVDRGLERVVISCHDPHPAVAGTGAKALESLGVDLFSGIASDSYRWVNRSYFYGVATGLPWIDVKWAVSADGFIAPSSGNSRWITGEKSRAFGHRIRSRVSAVMIGAETLRQDDPRLTDRVTDRGHQPRAIIVARDPERLPTDSRLFQDRAKQTYLIIPARVDQAAVHKLERLGVGLIRAELRNERFDWDSLLPRLRRRGFGRILVEGGGYLVGSMVEAGYACEIHGFYSGRLFGQGTKPLQFNQPPAEVREAQTVRLLETHPLEDDVYVRRLGPVAGAEDWHQQFQTWQREGEDN